MQISYEVQLLEHSNHKIYESTLTNEYDLDLPDVCILFRPFKLNFNGSSHVSRKPSVKFNLVGHPSLRRPFQCVPLKKETRNAAS